MKMTKEERKVFQKFGTYGGKARAVKMTPEQRSESAKKAAAARWKKAKGE